MEHNGKTTEHASEPRRESPATAGAEGATPRNLSGTQTAVARLLWKEPVRVHRWCKRVRPAKALRSDDRAGTFLISPALTRLSRGVVWHRSPTLRQPPLLTFLPGMPGLDPHVRANPRPTGRPLPPGSTHQPGRHLRPARLPRRRAPIPAPLTGQRDRKSV